MYEDERVDVIQRHNRALRIVHRQLRRALKYVTEYNDNLFLELCETNKEAELALEELRLRGGLDCSPQDYSTIVELAVEALKQQSRKSMQGDL